MKQFTVELRQLAIGSLLGITGGGCIGYAFNRWDWSLTAQSVLLAIGAVFVLTAWRVLTRGVKV